MFVLIGRVAYVLTLI